MRNTVKCLFLIGTMALCTAKVDAQDTLSTETMIRYLYAVYYNEGFNSGEFDSYLLKKTEAMCYRALDEDSSNFQVNYYLTLLYYNEMSRIPSDPNEFESIRRDTLREKYEFYSERAKRIEMTRQKHLIEDD